ncbi:unnamed protein product [Orchesella dallaii]|uniref:C2H2-type domain-containing protein n=1 Tax=Orchesella dallaii TaxID=48710 RepID=A0ABP1RV03_9HEXA
MDISMKVKDEPVEYLEDLESVDEGEEDSSQSEEGDEDKSEEEEGDLEIKEEVDSENDDDNDNEHQHEEDNDKLSSEEEESISESEDEKKSERSKVPKERHQNVVKLVKKNGEKGNKINITMTAEEKLKAKRASNAASSRRLRQRRKEEAEKLKKGASSSPKRVKLDFLSKKERDRERKRLQRVQQRAQMTPEEIAVKNRELAQRKVMQRIEKKAKMTEEELAEKREGERLLYLQKKAEKGEEMFKKKRERDNARNAKMSEEERKKKNEYGKKWRENWNEEQHEKHLEKVRKYYQRKSKKLKDQEPDKLEEMRRQWREKDKARRELERKMKAEGKEVTKKQYKKREKQGTFDRVKYLRDRRAQETPEERQKRLNQGKKNAAKRKLRKNLLEAGASAEQIKHELWQLEKTFQPSTRTLKRRTRSATENNNEGNNTVLLGGFMPPIPFQEIEVPLPSNFVSISETTGYNTQIISYYPNYPNQQIENIEIIQEYHQLQQQQQDADSNMSIIGNVDSNSYDVQDRPKDDHVELHDFSIVSGNQPLSSSSAFFEAPSSSYSPFPVPKTLPFEESIKSDAAASENEVAANENEAASNENEPAAIENEATVNENEAAAGENEAAANKNEAAANENEVAANENEVSASGNEAAANENDAVTIPTPSPPPFLPATDEEERISSTTTVIIPPRKGPGRPRLHPPKPPKTSRPRKLPSNPSVLVECNICNQSYTSYTLPEHQRYYHHPNFNPDTKTCTSCSSSGPFRGGRDFYLNHWKPIHLKKPKIEEQIKPFICDECGATYKGQRGLEMHKETKHDNVKVSCPHCNQEFIGKPALNSHLLRLHNNEGKHPCLRCDFKAPFQDKLKTHVEKEHPSSYFPCEMCNTLKYTLADKFSHYKNCRKRPTSQTQAKLVNEEGKKGKAYNQIPTKCEICEAILTLQALCKHYLEVHDVLNERFKCEFCQKLFKKREYWVGHLEVVHEVDICSEEMKEKMRKYYVKDRSEVVIKNPNGGHHGRFANRSFKKKRKKKSLNEEDDGNDNDEEVEEEEPKPRRQGERRRGRRRGAGVDGYGDIEKDKRLVVPLVRISEEEVQKWGRRKRKETIIKIIKEENEVEHYENIIDDFREVK